jgi:AhpD family alkylhydroperoxidase
MRLAQKTIGPELLQATTHLEMKIRAAGLDKHLLHLIKARASQINNCAYCLDLHTKEARTDGESEERLHLLAVWREAVSFTPKERAALAWTETVTRLSDTHVPDAEWEAVRREFSEEEVAKLTVAIGMVNLWNRLAVSFRSTPGAKPGY